MGYNPAELRDAVGRWTTGGSSAGLRTSGSYSGPLRSEVSSILGSTHPLLVRGNMGVAIHNSAKDYDPRAPEKAIAAYEPSVDTLHVFANGMSRLTALQKNIDVHHELFHRLDFDAGRRGRSIRSADLRSADLGYRRALAHDMGSMSVDDKRKVSYVTSPMESYAEILARMGLPPEAGDRVLQVFPRSRAWLERHIVDLGLRR